MSTKQCKMENLQSITFTIPKYVRNYRSLDLFANGNDILLACDFVVLRKTLNNGIDTKDLKNLNLYFDTKNREITFNIPILPLTSIPIPPAKIDSDVRFTSTVILEEYEAPTSSSFKIIKQKMINYEKLIPITESCTLYVDNKQTEIEIKFSYGFGCRFTDNTAFIENILHAICSVINPLLVSPIQRRILREKHENSVFCRDQYKLNFFELQVPDGLENPTKFRFDFSDTKLSPQHEIALATIKSETPLAIDSELKSIIDAGLCEILFAICYDIRTTENDSTCESPWTRNMLSSSLRYFEPIDNLQIAIISFLRRSLCHPLYRNYDLSRICIEDAITALQKGTKWILKQFLNTYEMFLNSFDSRQLLNQYFINDYIRYLDTCVSDAELGLLSRNLKNIYMNVTKKDIGLDLINIEKEVLHQLIDDMRLREDIDDNDDNDDDFNEDEDEADNEEDDVSSTSSATEDYETDVENVL